MQWPRVSVCDWWAHGTHTDRHGQSMRAFILSNVPKSASLPYSGLSGTKLPHNAILHSEKIQDLLISPPPVAPCFLLPAIIALLVWSHKQGWSTRWLDKGEPIQHPYHSHSSEAATVTCSQLQAQPSVQKSPRKNSHFRDPRHVRRAHLLLYPLGLQHTVEGCKPHP